MECPLLLQGDRDYVVLSITPELRGASRAGVTPGGIVGEPEQRRANVEAL